jgi:hypothetical protein
MARYSPQFNAFKLVLKFDKINFYLTWSAFILALVPIIIDQFDLIKKNNEDVKTIIEIFSMIVILAGFIIVSIKDFYLFPKAETKRRHDFIDNGLGVTFSLRNSEDYYTNNDLTPGMYKLGVNLFQNVYFTTLISKKMRPKHIWKASSFAGVFILIAIYGLKNSPIALPILQFLFSASILGDLIKLLLFVNRNEKILDQVKTFFSAGVKNESIILKNYIEYETNLAWGMILLDDTIFNKYNTETEQEWQAIKNRYNIHG